MVIPVQAQSGNNFLILLFLVILSTEYISSQIDLFSGAAILSYA